MALAKVVAPTSAAERSMAKVRAAKSKGLPHTAVFQVGSEVEAVNGNGVTWFI